MKIIIVDDNIKFIKSITDFLEMELGHSIVTTFYDGEEFMKNQHKYTYDIVLMDINMPVLNGFETVKNYNIDYFQTSKVIAITFDNTVQLLPLIEHGFKGCILKTNVFDLINDAIKTVSNGKNYWDKTILKNLH